MALNLVCAVLDRGPANLAEMAVLLAIADSADKDTGEAWPAQATIARRSRQTERSVRNILVRLRAAGWLTWEARRRANGSQASSVYTISLAKLGEDRGAGQGQAEPRSASRRNHVPPPPEPRSAHAPEPRSALEPSQKKEPSARKAGAGKAARSPHESGARPALRGPEAEGLTAYQRASILADRSCLVAGRVLSAGSPELEALRQALRAQEAGEGLVHHG